MTSWSAGLRETALADEKTPPGSALSFPTVCVCVCVCVRARAMLQQRPAALIQQFEGTSSRH